MAMNAPDDHSQVGGSASVVLAGYDYQVDVSIWIALDLMLSTEMTKTGSLVSSFGLASQSSAKWRLWAQSYHSSFLLS